MATTQKKIAKAKAPKVAHAKPAGTHPPYNIMIVNAISHLKDRKGSSKVAILRYITSNYNVGDEEKKVNANIKKSLNRLVTSGELTQVKGQGASGSFRLGEKETNARPKLNAPGSPAPKVPKAKVKKASPKKKTVSTTKKTVSPKKKLPIKPKLVVAPTAESSSSPVKAVASPKVKNSPKKPKTKKAPAGKVVKKSITPKKSMKGKAVKKSPSKQTRKAKIGAKK